MKKLLILPLLVLLTGCVTYYYPQTAMQDGVYYAEDDPSYVVYSDGYAGAAYYPWSSLDYFYLGYYPYPRYGYGYGGGFSFGVSYGYSPWYYPYGYYGYYSPWYASYSHYPYYPAWRPYHGYYSRHNGGHHKYNKGYRGDGRDRYVENDNQNRRSHGDENEDRYEKPDDRRNQSGQFNSYSASRVNRYVSTAPSGYSSNRGMVIRNRETTKTGKSRLEPTKSVPVQAVSVSSSNSRTAQPSYRTRRSGSEVRYSAAAKQGRSRTGPVESSAPSQGIRISAPQSRAVVATGNDARSRQSAPATTSRQASGSPASGNSNRSRSGSSSSSPSQSRQRQSSQGHVSRRERRK